MGTGHPAAELTHLWQQGCFYLIIFILKNKLLLEEDVRYISLFCLPLCIEIYELDVPGFPVLIILSTIGVTSFSGFVEENTNE